MENNEKKRTGRRATFWWIILGLMTIAFYACMFKFKNPEIGLKWWIAYASISGVGTLFVNGLLTVTDVKSFIPLPFKK